MIILRLLSESIKKNTYVRVKFHLSESRLRKILICVLKLNKIVSTVFTKMLKSLPHVSPVYFLNAQQQQQWRSRLQLKIKVSIETFRQEFRRSGFLLCCQQEPMGVGGTGAGGMTSQPIRSWPRNLWTNHSTSRSNVTGGQATRRSVHLGVTGEREPLPLRPCSAAGRLRASAASSTCSSGQLSYVNMT